MQQHILQQHQPGPDLNEVQKAAVEHYLGPLLLLASPGSGKTTTLIMRIGHLIRYHNVHANQIIAVSFNKSAAHDMDLRYKKFFPELPSVNFSTIHSLAFEIARQGFRKRGMAFEVIEHSHSSDEKEKSYDIQEQMISKNIILRQLYERLYQESMKDDALEELLTYISYVKNKMIPQLQWSTLPCKVKRAHEILELYEHYKRSGEKTLLDFDDMLVYAEQFLREDIQLRQQYKRRYQFVLTDESQDTSLIQHHIIGFLVEDHQNICVVADDDQSIYSWRGAEPSYLLSFKEHYPTAQIMYMEQNYRSSQDIVWTANQFIKKNHKRYPKNMFTSNEAKEPIQFRQFPTVYEEVRYISDQLQCSTELQETAILYRNHYSSIMLINELDRRGIPFYMKDGDDRFFSHWVVEDIKNFMRLSYTDRRMDIFEKIAMKMNVYLSKQQILQCKALHKGESIFELLQEQVTLQDYQLELIKQAQKIVNTLREVTPQEAIRKIRDDLGYDKAISGLCERLGFRKEYLMSILNSLEGIGEGLSTLVEFVERLDHLAQVQKKAKHRKYESTVTLSTLHSAKGLEFNNVYMMDLVHQVIPSRNDQESTELMEEAVRLFYVGLTRARNCLHLLSVQQWQNERARESEFVQAVKMIQEQKTKQKAILSMNPNALKDSNLLKQGMTIRHSQFGKGVIAEIHPLKMKIEFVEHGMKVLLIELCMTQGLLELDSKVEKISTS